jgi:dolichyl-phosphate-mannose-protein mannosyltransferase
MKQVKAEALVLTGILALALAIRVWGIGFGLPYAYHADEAAIVRRALAFGLGDLNPHSFHWPAFHLYALFALYGLTFLVGKALGAYASAEDFARQYFQDPTIFYLAGRGLSAFLGTATVYLTYRAGRILDGSRAGLFAALCLALTYYHVRDSHLATLDVPATFWVALAFVAAATIHRAAAPPASAYAAAGAFAGLAAATKYNAGAVALAIAAAHALRQERPPISRLAIAALTAGVAFAAATPFNLIDWDTFARDARFQTRHLSEGQWGLGQDSALAYYAHRMLFVQMRNTEQFVFDPMALLFAIAAIAAFRASDRRTALLVFVVPVVYLCYIGRWGMAATRYLDPIFPMLAVATGVWLARRSNVGLALAGIAALFSLRSVLLSDWVLTRSDTRTEAKTWIEEHIPAGSRIALEAYGPPIVASPETLDRRIEKLESGDLRHPTQSVDRLRRYYQWMKLTPSRATYDVVRLDDSLEPGGGDANRVPAVNYDLGRLRDLGVRYVIVSSFLYERYREEKARHLYPALVGFYRTLERDYPRVKEFRPAAWQPGPALLVYDLGASP